MDRWVHTKDDIWSSLPARGPSLSQHRQRLIPILIAVTSAAVLGVPAIRALDPEVNGGADRFAATNRIIYEQLKCIEDQAVKEIPLGSRVVVDQNDAYWTQRLPQALFARAVIVEDKTDADLSVGVKADEAGCMGTSLAVTAP